MKYVFGSFVVLSAVFAGHVTADIVYHNPARTGFDEYARGRSYVYAEVVDVEPVCSNELGVTQTGSGIWMAGGQSDGSFSRNANCQPIEYGVTYLFRGKAFHVRLDHPPGNRIKVVIE